MDPKRKAERAEFNRHIRARIRLIAVERGLPDAEIKPVLSRLHHQEILRFAERHRLSLDWLLCGCLKGRRRMVNATKWPPTDGAAQLLVSQIREIT